VAERGVAAVAEIWPWRSQLCHICVVCLLFEEWSRAEVWVSNSDKAVGAAVNVPKTVQSPAILGPDRGTGIPELRLEQLSSGVNEAAAVWGDGRVVAGQRSVDRAARGAGVEGVARWRCYCGSV
jgi:hypothetical protein